MATKFEKTVVLIKPSGVSRALIGEVIKRIELKGLKIVGLKMMQLSDALLAVHYSHIVDKPFYPALATSMQRTPVVACCVEGVEAVQVIRDMIGVTNGRRATSGTIRGDFSVSAMENIVHASDSLEASAIEIERFFNANEIVSYDHPLCLFLNAEYEIK